MPLRGPLAVGLKRTLTVQLWPPVDRKSVAQGKRVERKWGWLALAAETPSPWIVRLPPPELLNVTVTGLLVAPVVTERKSPIVVECECRGGVWPVEVRATSRRPAAVLM